MTIVKPVHFLFFQKWLTIPLVCISFQQVSFGQTTSQNNSNPTPASLGHIMIYVTDIESSLAFYQQYLQMEVHEKSEGQGGIRCFLSNTDSHHQLVLIENNGITDTTQRVLQQIAFKVPDRNTFVQYYNMLKGQEDIELKNNQISWSIYLQDPDQNEIEIYWDIREQPFGKAQWNNQTTALTEEELLQGKTQ